MAPTLHRLDFGATDNWSGVASVDFVFSHANGAQLTVGASDNSPGTSWTSSATQKVKNSWVLGQYTLVEIVAADDTGNTATYLPDGSIVLSGGALQGPTSHTIDYTTLGFVIV